MTGSNGLSKVERLMRNDGWQVALVYKQFDAADYQAVKFSSAGTEPGRVTCSSLVLLGHSYSSTSGQAPLSTLYVCRVNVLMSHVPP